MSKYLWIIPADVLLFRNGRPFEQGGDHYAESVFPPAPSVLYGALRTAGIASSGASFTDFITGKSASNVAQAYGSPMRHGEFNITSVFLGRNQEPLFPTPFDLVSPKQNASSHITLLQPLRDTGFTSSLHPSLFPLWTKKDGILAHNPGFLTLEQFQAYLSGQVPVRYLTDSEVRQTENRTGVALDPETGAVRTGMLYTAQYVRIFDKSLSDQFGFIVGYRGDNGSPLPTSGWLRLGGESRPAHFVQLDSCDYPLAPDFSNGRFKLVLATPALFENGWLPRGIRKENGALIFKDSECGISAKLVAAAIGKAVPIGGWDIANRRPKSIFPAVPAGSVYFFELQSGTNDAVKQKFHGCCISDFAKTSWEGFGLTFIGGWNYV